MADYSRYVFRCSADAHQQVTSLFDFIHPTTIALWNLRWQVTGYLAQVPDASSDMLSSRFALGSGARGGELKRACTQITWDQQQEQFAQLLLIALVSNFEDFTYRLSACFARNDKETELLASSLQFPSSIGSPPGKKGRFFAFQKMNNPSASMANVFTKSARANSKYDGKRLDNLLVCYRFFKEMRNGIAHNGGRATERTLNAYNNFCVIAIKDELGLNEVPAHSAIKKDEQIRLSLRGVIGLSEVILKIIATFDAEMCETEAAERELCQRLKPQEKAKSAIKNTIKARNNRIQKLAHQAFLPPIEVTALLVERLKLENIIPAFWLAG